MVAPTREEERLLEELRTAVHAAARPVREIEVGIPLSIALGKLRPESACGGCSIPLEFEGIPARTDLHLRAPFRLKLAAPPAGA